MSPRQRLNPACLFWIVLGLITICTTSVYLQERFGKERRYGVTQLEGLPQIVSVSTQWRRSVAVAADGSYWYWGENPDGAEQCWRVMGPAYYREQFPCSTRPVRGTALQPVTMVALNDERSLVVTLDGRVWENYLDPEQVAGLPPIKQAGIGSDHAVALARDGTVWAWGINEKGQLGAPTTGSCRHVRPELPCSDQPLRVSGLPPIRAIAAGEFHTLALDWSGRVWAWGQNTSGELGGASVDRCGTGQAGVDGLPCSRAPQQIPTLDGIQQIAAGSGFSLALDGRGQLWGWGSNWYRQLGYDAPDRCGTDAPCSRTPRTLPPFADIRAITAAGICAAAIDRGGQLWSWGGVHPQAEGDTDGDPGLESAVPALQRRPRELVAVARTGDHNLAVSTDGTVWAWGYNTLGQLGIGRAK